MALFRMLSETLKHVKCPSCGNGVQFTMPSFDGMRNLQRLLKPRNPKIGELKVEDVIDNRIMRKLDESGFIDRAYAAQGVTLK